VPPRFEDHESHIYSLLSAALVAADPSAAVQRHLPRELHGKPVRVIAAGKASRAMLEGLMDCGCALLGGVLVAPPRAPDDSTRSHHPGLLELKADHPLPTERNVEAAKAVLEEVRGWSSFARTGSLDSGLVVLLSGGASAHLTLPCDGLTLDDLRAATKTLLLAGATIQELNCVRKHCEVLKGGGLAREAAPAALEVLILSDVIGDDLSSIASGPTAPDATTYQEALSILDRHGALQVALRLTAHLRAGADGLHPETVRAGDPVLSRVSNRIVTSNAEAVKAAVRAAGQLGFQRVVGTAGLVGEASHRGHHLGTRGRDLRERAPAAVCVIFGGETTVTVHGQGRGGRNQEFALGAAIAIDGVPGIVIASFATDGIDGPTDAAGAIVTGGTCARARALGVDPRQALEENDSYTFFSRVGGLIRTGPSGTNVNDVALLLVYPEASAGAPATPMRRPETPQEQAEPPGDSVVH
jgi:hydroxypyruvate reductase